MTTTTSTTVPMTQQWQQQPFCLGFFGHRLSFDPNSQKRAEFLERSPGSK